jgi:hypothetical protein
MHTLSRLKDSQYGGMTGLIQGCKFTSLHQLKAGRQHICTPVILKPLRHQGCYGDDLVPVSAAVDPSRSRPSMDCGYQSHTRQIVTVLSNVCVGVSGTAGQAGGSA